ncbi:hypothetical protein [Desulfosporosinus sp.]
MDVHICRLRTKLAPLPFVKGLE